jgi:serine/threonine-protein kinase
VGATRFLYPAPPPPADLVQVPDLRGVGLATGGERLAAAGLVLGPVDSLRHPSMPRDLVLGQTPLAGQLALPGTEVRVTRSLGPQTRPVPDVLNVDASRAVVVLETGGFQVLMDSVESDIPRGRVVSTRPGANAVVAVPAEIRLAVSKGPPLVLMPQLLGMDELRAMAILDSLGLVLGTVEELIRPASELGTVVDQAPAADTPLERGSAVRLAVGRQGV